MSQIHKHPIPAAIAEHAPLLQNNTNIIINNQCRTLMNSGVNKAKSLIGLNPIKR